MSTFHYLVGKTSWGIAIFLTAEARHFAGDIDLIEEVAPGIWLSTEQVELTSEERMFLKVGLRLVAEGIRKHSNLPIVIHIVSLDFNICDYQPEGLAGAISGWASKEFAFPEIEIPVDFDHSQNRYRFHFPQL